MSHRVTHTDEPSVYPSFPDTANLLKRRDEVCANSLSFKRSKFAHKRSVCARIFSTIVLHILLRLFYAFYYAFYYMCAHFTTCV